MSNFSALQKIIAEAFGADAASVTNNSRLAEDLKADSMGMLALTAECEKEFDVPIAADDLASFVTVGDVVKFIDRAK